MPEFQDKPMMQEVANANIGEKVVLEGVTVKNLLDKWGPADNPNKQIQPFYVTSPGGGSEAFVKYFAPDRAVEPGDTITVVGTKAEYQGKISVEVRSNKGGGIASEGEPLAYSNPVQQPAPAQAAPRAAPARRATGKRSFLIFYYDDTLTKMSGKYSEEKNAASATHSVMIAYYRDDISEEELVRWLDPEADDIPF